MKLLTVLALPSTISNMYRLRESFKGIPSDFIILGDGRDYNTPVFTKWKIFVYEDEWLSIDLRENIPTFLEIGGEYEFMSVYKKIKNKVDLSPRLYKNKIELKKDCIYPINDNVSNISILDGFIYGEDYDKYQS